jgi:uncharacterized membrane protein
MINTSIKTGKLTFLGVMLALTFVFVAMTAIPTTSASMALLIFIPTIVTSITKGPKSGATIGFFAGLATLIRALLAPASPLDYLFINPLVAILPRILIGIVPYYIYVIFKKVIKSETVSLLIAGISGAITNTGFVILALYLLYYDTIVQVTIDFGIGTSFKAFALFLVTTSLVIEAAAAGIGTASIIMVYNKMKH